MAEKKVVISIFENEAAADAAVVALKDAGIAREDAIGVLVLGQNGDVKTHKVGSHSFYKGAGIGLVLGLLGPVGVRMGAAAGGLLGLLHHKGLGLHDSHRERISAELAEGKAAVGVLTGLDEADATESMLTHLGGVSEAHTVDDEALEAVADAAAPAGGSPAPLRVPAVRASKLEPRRLRADALQRERLLARLAGADTPIVLIAASAGYGKSTLAAQWSTRCQRPVAWLNLDRADNDPIVFLNALAHALDRLDPVAPELLDE
ncbi:MAG TPA: DUF1269 domain-containing protein, partial [Gaiellaceae bacterium]|nr:DUF1269 domain-containing protein [Gaiellaceae bacterium]